MSRDDSKFNKWFSSFILIGMTAALVIITLIKLRQPGADAVRLIVAAFGSLMGVCATVAASNGKIITFLFGILDVTIYGVMCMESRNWGTAALHVLYLLPMQFVGIWQWKKRGGRSSRTLKARRFTGRQWLLAAGAFLLTSLVAYIILLQFDERSANTFFIAAVLSDALVTVCNIFGQFLMSTAFMEQWIFWIGVNISSIVMWSIKLAESDSTDYAVVYIIKYTFYLINALNGLRIWYNLSKPEKIAEK